MSVAVLNAHIGSTHSTNPNSFSTLDEFRAWITRKTGIQVPDQILMTARGKPVKLQSLDAEEEIFLYDRSILASATAASRLLPTKRAFEAYTPPDPPKSPKLDDLHDLQEVSKKRRDWALQVLNDTRNAINKLKEYDAEKTIVSRAVAIAVNNVRQHLANLRPKYEETKAWADETSRDQQDLLARWRPNYNELANIRVNADFSRCLKDGDQASERRRAMGNGTMTLQDYVEKQELEQAYSLAEDLTGHFISGLRELEVTYTTIANESQGIIREYQNATSLEDSDLVDQGSRLQEEVEVLTRKIGSDYQYISGLSEDSKSLAQASKTAQMHSNNFIPSIIQTVEEIDELGRQIAQRSEDTRYTSVLAMQKISRTESKLSSMHAKMAKLDVDPRAQESCDMLDFVINLPSIYGTYLVEYVRRCEWAQQTRAKSPSSRENVMVRKKEETRRRKQWQKDTGNALVFNELGDVGLAASSSVEPEMPLASNQDVVDYIQQLESSESFKDACREVRESADIFDTTQKPRSQTLQAFKNGSLHEAAQGQASIVLPDSKHSFEDLQREKLRVDDKLRSAESRIRKLEDLLHRQSQLPRPPSASGFNPGNPPAFERQMNSPVPTYTSALSKARDGGSRRSSMSSRRVSQNLDPEEKSLAQRIVSLEADLIAHKKDASARLKTEENLKVQVNEAIATKEDLLGNMEAQQHEFESERRFLEQENSKLSIRLEEVEDEYDRMLNNTEQIVKLHALQEENEHLQQKALELERARASDARIHQNRIGLLEEANEASERHKTGLENTIEQLHQHLDQEERMQSNHHHTLARALTHLASDLSAPEDHGSLVKALDSAAQKSAVQQSEIRNAIEQLQATNASLESRLESRGNEAEALADRFADAERDKSSLVDRITAKTAETDSLRQQLDSTTAQRNASKSMANTSAKENESLLQQLAEEKAAHSDLQNKFTSLQGYHGELDDQLQERSEELTHLKQQLQSVNDCNETQASRADEISRRLQLQIETQKRLLEMVGLMITRQDESMSIQRVPKTAISASTTIDPSMSMRRSLSGTMPTKKDLEAAIDTDALHWAKAGTLDESATRFDEFIKAVSEFDVDIFNEAIYKRIKDIEHIARKWQREAKAHRDKAHRAQSDAHEKITLRSFKEGDLALFLPTRDQATKPWAAFNVGAPHYFLREQDSHKLGKREWLIARISKVEERVVDLSKSMNGVKAPGERKSTASGLILDDDNPYELSDGLRWYLVDAAEEKPGAPISIGMGKATVAMSRDEEPMKASIGIKKSSNHTEVSKTLARSLDSRRSSTNSRKSVVANSSAPAGLEGMLKRSDSNVSRERRSFDVPDGPNVEPSRMQEIQPAEVTSPDGGSPSKTVDARSTSPRKGSPVKRRSKWDSLLSLDLSIEGGKAQK